VSRIRFHGSPIGPDIGAAPAARLTGKPLLKIGQADIIGPSITADCCVMAATKIGAVDQETANASGAHFGEGDFLRTEGHASLKRCQTKRAIVFGGGPTASRMGIRGNRIAALALKRGKSVDFTGYWQRHISA
jgi:hypothetical protein